MKRFFPLLSAGMAALVVALVAGSIDSRYEATASARVQVLFGSDQVASFRSLGGLPAITPAADSPLFPGGASALRRVAARTAQRVGGAPLEPDAVRVIDTRAQLLPAVFTEPIHRLKVKAVAEQPEAAARTANAYLTEYLRERDRLIDRQLTEARSRLSISSSRGLSGISPAGRAELIEAADIAGELHGGVLTYGVVPASAPTEPISPRPLRDTIVAALIGGLVGWLVTRGGGVTLRRAARRAPASA